MPVPDSSPILSVRDLNVRFGRNTIPAVSNVNFDVGRERVGIVGESGSGKSTTGRAAMRLLPKSATVTAERMDFLSEPLLEKSERQMGAIRGSDMALIMQDPRYSLNPVLPIGKQVAEAAELHLALTGKAARGAARDMLLRVRINDPERVAKLYPHEVSGGMGQRIMIAMMLIPEPELLIADEPTSALDVSVQAQVLDIIDDLVTRKGMGLILISHDLALVSRYCDRILVMNAGRVVEECAAGQLDKAQHPYTRGLLAAMPVIDETRDELPVLDRTQWAGT